MNKHNKKNIFLCFKIAKSPPPKQAPGGIKPTATSKIVSFKLQNMKNINKHKTNIKINKQTHKTNKHKTNKHKIGTWSLSNNAIFSFKNTNTKNRHEF